MYRGAWAIDRGNDAELHSALAKLQASEAAVRSGVDAVHLHGARGVLAEEGLEDWVRDALPGTVYSGANEVLGELVAGLITR